ncbi:phosphoribosylanthranilate isomerase [Candidatus Palauibacter soopunensis]|uniref:phosphoribosylanthranilate isomerase n=1 Tax=Candidatus Palauibacter soopunensis TaxID=3056739 RepID=UPI00238AF01E|nr:phosphoribosylanthranilate isomerase [Candidatus Palauibacter soopunensis]MDE2879274.1 phosphoribosylanthranilate isomerase [Candidatus Palauibacter soopunensis]
MSRVGVKICGLREPRDATATSRAGADYVGVVFAGRVREVTAGEAAAVVAALEGGARAVGVFVDTGPAEILRKRDVAGFHIAQLAGAEPPEVCDRLRGEGLDVWKGLRPTSSDALVRGWDEYREAADAVLVEGFSPRGPGGTGTAFPYEWLAGLQRDGCALALAGGLNAENVVRAIRDVRPDIVDVSSGVERAPGEKSIDLILDFLAVAK